MNKLVCIPLIVLTFTCYTGWAQKGQPPPYECVSIAVYDLGGISRLDIALNVRSKTALGTALRSKCGQTTKDYYFDLMSGLEIYANRRYERKSDSLELRKDRNYCGVRLLVDLLPLSPSLPRQGKGVEGQMQGVSVIW